MAKSSHLTAGLAAQSAIRDKVVDRTEASKALITACKNDITFEEALQLSSPRPAAKTNKLGELLIESGLVDEQTCRQALAKSVSTGLPLGRILITAGTISEEVLLSLLEFQLRIRDGLVSREEALVLLRSAPHTALADENKTFSGQHTVRLGELLIRAGVLQRSDVSNVLEVGLHTGKRMGELLIQYGFVDQQLLEAALNLQQMVDSSFLLVEQASQILRYLEEKRCTIATALVDLNMVTVPTQATRPDSTFGLGDTRNLKPIPRSRTRRLLQNLQSDEEARVNPVLEEAYGGLVTSYSTLAQKHFIFENFNDAIWLLERIIALKERMRGHFHRGLVTDLLRLSEAHLALKEYEQAQSPASRAVDILENTQPYDGILLAQALNALGCIYFDRNLHFEAEAFLEPCRHLARDASACRRRAHCRRAARLRAAFSRHATSRRGQQTLFPRPHYRSAQQEQVGGSAN